MCFYQLVPNQLRLEGILSRSCWLPLAAALLTQGCASGGAKPIVQPPSITSQPTNQVVVVGQTATFTAVATGTPPLTYQWNKNGTAIAGATSTSYTTPPTVEGDDGANFTMTVTNAINSATSMPAALKVLPAPPPQTGDLRFQQVDAPSTINGYVIGGIHTNIFGGLSETFSNAVGTPLSLGDACGSPNGNPFACGWVFDTFGLPTNVTGLNVGYVSANRFANLDSDVGNIDSGHAVITSVDLHPEDDTYAISYLEAVQSTGFTLTRGTVAPSALQSVATQEGSLSHVITAVSFNAGNVTYFSYAWESDPSTVYEAEVATATYATLGQAATNLGQAGYLITALGGNGTHGFVLVGTRVKGNTAPRPVLVGTAGSQQSQQILSQGYAIVGYIVQYSGGVSATTFIGEK
jgi:Immunoglobulin domain